MSKETIIDISLKTSVKVFEEVDQKWIDGLVRELENEAEDKMDMGFSSAWEVRKVEEMEE